MCLLPVWLTHCFLCVWDVLGLYGSVVLKTHHEVTWESGWPLEEPLMGNDKVLSCEWVGNGKGWGETTSYSEV